MPVYTAIFPARQAKRVDLVGLQHVDVPLIRAPVGIGRNVLRLGVVLLDLRRRGDQALRDVAHLSGHRPGRDDLRLRQDFLVRLQAERGFLLRRRIDQLLASGVGRRVLMAEPVIRKVDAEDQDRPQLQAAAGRAAVRIAVGPHVRSPVARREHTAARGDAHRAPIQRVQLHSQIAGDPETYARAALVAMRGDAKSRAHLQRIAAPRAAAHATCRSQPGLTQALLSRGARTYLSCQLSSSHSYSLPSTSNRPNAFAAKLLTGAGPQLPSL